MANLTFMSQDDYDHLVNGASLERVEWSEEVREHKGVKYVVSTGMFQGEHYQTFYECNLTRRSTEAELIEWIEEVFADVI